MDFFLLCTVRPKGLGSKVNKKIAISNKPYAVSWFSIKLNAYSLKRNNDNQLQRKTDRFIHSKSDGNTQCNAQFFL